MLQCSIVVITEQCLEVLHVCLTVFPWNEYKTNVNTAILHLGLKL